MNQRLAKNKEYPTISIMLNALFFEHKPEEAIQSSFDPLLLKKSVSLLKQKTVANLLPKNQ
jgi:hypothetical protein